jgi:hypothetical protein
VAPPGAGKTALVASWLGQGKLRHLWLQLDEGDSDVAAFFHYLALAAGTLGQRRSVLPAFTPDCLAALGGYSRRFFRALCAGTKQPQAIVLDDYHEIRPDSPLHAALRDGLLEVPQGILVAVLSRSEPPATLARLQAIGSLVVLHGDALVLNERESKAIAARWGFSERDRDLVLGLHARTEGWAAGLVLLLANWRPGAGAQQKSGQEKVLFDYFAEEVLARADQDTRTVLVEMALLPRVSGTMAVRLTGLPSAGEILADLSMRGYFVVPHDASEPTYQFHALLREFLLRRAERTLTPERRAELRLLAARLFEDAGQVEDAFDLHLQAGAWADATRLVVTRASSLLSEGRAGTVARWILSIPAEIWGRDPWLLLWLGASLLPLDPGRARGHLERAFDFFRQAEATEGMCLAWAAVAETYFVELDDLAPLDRWISTLDMLRGRCPECFGTEIEARLVTAALGALMNRQPWHPALHHWEERALSLALSPGDPAIRLTAGQALALYYGWWAMDLSKARLLVESLRPLWAGRRADPTTAIFWHIADANHHLHLARIDACVEAVDRGLAISAESGFTLLNSFLLSLRCWAAVMAGDLATAGQTLEQMGGGERTPRLSLCAYHYAACVVARHRGELGLAREHGRRSVDLAVGGGMPLAQTSCRLASALAEPPESQEVALETALDQARRCDSQLVQVGSLLGLAAAAMRRGDEARAVTLLREGFAIAKALGSLHVFWFLSEELAECCAVALAHEIEPRYVGELIRAQGLSPTERARALDSWPWVLRIDALGGFAVFSNGEQLRPGRKVQKKPLEMLRLLVAEGERGMRQDLLAEALWPDSEADAARFALGTTLYRLRRLLGRGEVIVQRDGRVALDPKFVFVDAWALERVLESASTGGVRPASTAARQEELRAKVRRLYRGDLFGADADEPRLARARERLRGRIDRYLGAA